MMPNSLMVSLSGSASSIAQRRTDLEAAKAAAWFLARLVAQGKVEFRLGYFCRGMFPNPLGEVGDFRQLIGGQRGSAELEQFLVAPRHSVAVPHEHRTPAC